MSGEVENVVTLAGYQEAARRTINRALEEDQRLMDSVAGLAEEAGEVLAHVRKHLFQGRPLDRDALALELGDALWCLAIAADTLGFTLQDVAARNVEKLRSRHPE